MKDKKPKCWGCRKRGEDIIYYWHDPNNKGGHLWHLSCIEKISEKINKNI